MPGKIAPGGAGPRIHHVALRTRDLARLERFYADVVGLPALRRAAGRVWLAAGGAVVMLEAAEPGEPEIPANCKEFLAFAIDASEAGAARARLARAGVPIESETAATVYFRDPDGRRVGFSHYVVD